MAVTQKGGHMVHSTVEDISPEPTVAQTSTGGLLAKSSKERLKAAFPGSPILNGDYNKEAVANLKGSLLTNTVHDDDVGSAAGYYGFTSPESSEPIPSSADLGYPAPDIPNVKSDDAGGLIASPYIPHLKPPESFGATSDNQTDQKTTADFQVDKTSRPPFVSEHKEEGGSPANPSATSAAIMDLRPKAGDGDGGNAPPPPPDGGS